MKLYCGIDLHSNNHVVVVIDAEDRKLVEKRIPNDLEVTRQLLSPYRERLHSVAVESTFNWYWLVDGLQDAGYPMVLANPAGMVQYAGLKHTDDNHDAWYLAHLSRLGLLPTGYIYPREQRAIRDLLRRRMTLVQMASKLKVATQSQIWRSTGVRVAGRDIARPDFGIPLPAGPVKAGTESQWHIYQQILSEIAHLEHLAWRHYGQLSEACRLLKTIQGVGPILSLTIALETGAIERFPTVGQYASYCRVVQADRLSNGKKKGQNNRKAGNKYLSWAFSEAAHFVVRFDPKAKRFFERKKRKTNGIVAIRAVAHKLSRAVWFMLRDQVPFDSDRLFAS